MQPDPNNLQQDLLAVLIEVMWFSLEACLVHSMLEYNGSLILGEGKGYLQIVGQDDLSEQG